MEISAIAQTGRCQKVKCPACKNKSRVEINLHSDGFANNLHECGDCGALWIHKEEAVILISKNDLSVNE